MENPVNVVCGETCLKGILRLSIPRLYEFEDINVSTSGIRATSPMLGDKPRNLQQESGVG
jgi:hypothetical protein